jgi:predicted anti-sigma-YlaC factor YlaD
MTKHDCARIEGLISARMDRATSPEEDARIERHLDDCPECRATALAFERVDREVGAYLRATPVPAIGTPWREARQAPRFAGWHPATPALTTILLLVVASVLAFGAFRGTTQTAQETSAPQSAYTSGGAAPSAAASTAPRAAPTAAAAAAAPSSAASAAPSAAPAQAPATRAGARATAAGTGAAPAASSAPSAATSGVPMLGGDGAPGAINPVHQFRLVTATALVVCQPDCVASPQGGRTLTDVIALLDRPLSRISPDTPATGPPAIVIRFTLADGQQVELRYAPSAGQLGLPDGTLLLAPDALRDVLAPPIPQP